MQTHSAQSNGKITPDRGAILAAASLILADSPGVMEVRAFGAPGQGTISGYFDRDHLDVLAKMVASTSEQAEGVYVTLNAVRPDLIARYSNRLQPRARYTTSDSDITRRLWLPVDVDSVRPSGMSASADEKLAAKERAGDIRRFLLHEGFEEPIVGDSGNGYHLLFRVDLPADDGGLVARVLQALAFRFGDEQVSVDAKNGNAARIWKLYGTVARKGSHVAERPHRLAKLLHTPSVIGIVQQEHLERIAAMAPTPQPVAPGERRSARSEFDLQRWMSERCPDATGPLPWNQGQKWVFAVCPWDPQHTNRAAYVVQFPGGAIAAGCQHNGCAGNDWRALRQLREPSWTPYRGPASRTAAAVVSEPHPQPRFHLTDLGNAERLVARHGHELRYCHKWRKWMTWDSKRWAIDESGEIERRCAETLRSMYAEARELEDADARKRLAAWAMTSESGGHIGKAIDLAQSLSGVPVSPDAFDRDPWLLTCENGTLDLRTGALREHRQADMISRLAHARYDPEAPCPRWQRFLSEVFRGDQEVIAFLLRALGYALTGRTTERVMFIFWGERRNGKSTLVETIGEILGDYGTAIRSDVLMADEGGKSNPNDLVDIPGKRFVWSSEVQEGRVFNEQRIKSLTAGRDLLHARYLYGEVFSFRPEFKLFLAANPKPELKGLDEALRDRLILMPFTQTFSKKPDEIALGAMPMDEGLAEALLSESAGILASLARGCLEWQCIGLQPPAAVKAATESYLDEVDLVGSFLSEFCQTDVEDLTLNISAKALYAAFCHKHGPKTLTQQALGRRLTAKGFRHSSGGRGSRWYGIRLLTEREQEQAPEGGDDRMILPSPDLNFFSLPFSRGDSWEVVTEGSQDHQDGHEEYEPGADG